MTIRIACLQVAARADESFDQRLADVGAAVDGIEADIIVLPELWATGFFAFDRYASDASRRQDVLDAMSSLARTRRALMVVGSQVERSLDGLLYNTTAVFAPDGASLADYRKIHLFGHGCGEARMLEAGREPVVFKGAGTTVGLTTCYDLRFPELYRLLADRGAEVLITTAAWPLSRIGHWELLNRARALENQCFVIACNGCGVDSGVDLGGRSGVFGPDGDPIVVAAENATLVEATIDLQDVARARTAFPVLDDRSRFLDVTQVAQPSGERRTP